LKLRSSRQVYHTQNDFPARGSNSDARTMRPDDDEKRLSHEGSNLTARTKRPDDENTPLLFLSCS
jgi:hypothetical protein